MRCSREKCYSKEFERSYKIIIQGNTQYRVRNDNRDTEKKNLELLRKSD